MPFHEQPPPQFYDQIDRARTARQQAAHERLFGPQAAAEPTATPGFKAGYGVTLDLSGGPERGIASLGPGIMAVRGQLVQNTEPIILTASSSTWVRQRAPLQLYYVFLGLDGAAYVDVLNPVWDADNFNFHHPQHTDWAAVGHLFVGAQKQVLFAASGIERRAQVTVGASAAYGADYQCDAKNDEVEINAAAQYLVNRTRDGGGGTVVLTQGTFVVGAQVDLRSPFIQLQGQGRQTSIDGRALQAITDVDLPAAGGRPAMPGVIDLPSKGNLHGQAATQLRDLQVVWAAGAGGQRYHTGWGASVSAPEPDAGEVRPALVSDVRARFPELWVGPLLDPPVEGQMRVFADDDGLRFEYYDANANSGAGAWDPMFKVHFSATSGRIEVTNLGGSTTAISAVGISTGRLGTRGSATINGSLDVENRADVGSLHVEGAADIDRDLNVDGNLNKVDGFATIDGKLTVGGNATLKKLLNLKKHSASDTFDVAATVKAMGVGLELTMATGCCGG